jgi:hypothetical protein
VGVEFRMNPDWQRDLKKEVNARIEEALREAAPVTKCPDHPEGHFTIETGADGPRVRGCCEKGIRLVMQQAGL